MGILNQMSTLRIEREDAICVAVDLQERLLPAMYESKTVEENNVRLLKGMKVLGIPTIVTQQYTKGIGETVSSVKEALGDVENFEHIEKTSFSCMDEPEFVKAIESFDKGTVILTGIEAHICVEQTALDLIKEGYNVALVTDCIQSRNPQNKERSIMRLANAGVIITTYESVLYELLKNSKAPEFKAISAIVK